MAVTTDSTKGPSLDCSRPTVYTVYIQGPIGREGAGRTFRSPHICNNHQPEKVSQIWIMNMQIEREREKEG